MGKMRVLLADDHAVLRDGIVALLSREPGMEVVGQAGNGAEALRLAADLRPDVVLLDLTMRGYDGLEAARRIRQVSPETSILVLTMHNDLQAVRQALEAGAVGYLLKSAAGDELISALRTVHQGGSYLHVAHRRALSPEAAGGTLQSDMPAHESLSPREQQVLQLIAQGYSNREMAAELGLSPKTVETYRARLTDKLGLRGRVALVRYAARHGLLPDVPVE